MSSERGGFAATVGRVRAALAAMDSGNPEPHIYRCFDGAWRLVHRHAEFPPEAQGKST